MIQDKDFTIRLIKQLSNLLAKLLLGKNEGEEEMSQQMFDTAVKDIFKMNFYELATKIRKLPTQLVESFKSTLDEVREADLLLHIVDISHESFEDHINSVHQILHEIDAHQKPMILIFNKIDDFSYEKKDEDDLTPSTRKNISLEEWEKTWMAKTKYPTIFISALNKQNFSEMKKIIYDEVLKIHISRFPYNDFLFEYFEEEDQ